jgi:hypothetical protein
MKKRTLREPKKEETPQAAKAELDRLIERITRKTDILKWAGAGSKVKRCGDLLLAGISRRVAGGWLAPDMHHCPRSRNKPRLADVVALFLLIDHVVDEFG